MLNINESKPGANENEWLWDYASIIFQLIDIDYLASVISNHTILKSIKIIETKRG